jgi:hypothetical protein
LIRIVEEFRLDSEQLTRFSGVDEELPRPLRLRAVVRFVVGDAGFGEGRHAGVAGERGAKVNNPVAAPEASPRRMLRSGSGFRLSK